MKNHLIILLIITLMTTILFTSEMIAKTRSKEVRITTEAHKIRPQYPFPDFLSTGPYIWYENTSKSPLKGHMYRISTFVEEHEMHVFLEKVEFGIGGCCLEIKEYHRLNLDEEFFRTHFPQHSGKYGFKLIRWLHADVFEFQAYGGTYVMSELQDNQPIISDLNH